eukprot:768815-Hanusia_phi.AAC.3
MHVSAIGYERGGERTLESAHFIQAPDCFGCLANIPCFQFEGELLSMNSKLYPLMLRVSRALRPSIRSLSTQQSSSQSTAGGNKQQKLEKHVVDDLLEVLACPLTKSKLTYNEETNELISEQAGVAYSIVNGIPNMIPQEARLIDQGAAKQGP